MKARQALTWLGGGLLAVNFVSVALGQDVQVVHLTPSDNSNISAAPTANPSAWFLEVVKLAQAGLDENVLLSYVATTPGTFNLSADQIIYLRDLGVSNDVISSILQHDQDLISGLRLAPAAATPPAPSARSIVEKWFGPAPAPITAAPATNAVIASAVPPTPPAPASVAEPDSTTAPPLPTPVSEPTPLPKASAFCAWHPNSADPDELYRVRKPYAEQLTEPILVYRAQGRVPNTMVLEMFP